VTWRNLRGETQNNVIDLRSTLIINDMLTSEHVIVVEASATNGIIQAIAKDLSLFRYLIRSRN